MKKLKLLVDLDGMCADMLAPWLAEYNVGEAHDDEPEVEPHMITTYELDKHVRNPKGLWDILRRDGFYRSLPELDGAVEGVQALCEQGHDVRICSSPGRSRVAPNDKTVWVLDRFPFLSQNQLILAHDKAWVQADVLLDDAPHQVAAYRAAWPAAKVMGIRWPYNRPEQFDLLADCWQNTRQAWQALVMGVNELAETGQVGRRAP